MTRLKAGIGGLVLLFALACGGMDLDARSGDQFVASGSEAYERGDYVTAVEELQQALDRGTSIYSEAEVWTRLGNAYLELDLLDKALEAHRNATTLDPTLVEAWVNLGVTLRKLDRYDEAEAAYREGLRLDPNYAEGWTSLGALFLLQGRYEDCIAPLEKAVEIDPTLPIALGNLAYGYAMVGRLDDAQATLERARVVRYGNADVVQSIIDDARAGQAGD